MLMREIARYMGLYAYRQTQSYNNSLYVVPKQEYNRYRQQTVKHKKAVKRKKKVNPIVFLIVLTFVLSLFSLYACFVFPTCYNNLIKPIISPTKISYSTNSMQGLAYSDTENINAVNLYRIAHPETNYLSNDLFLNTRMLAPTIQKVHSEVTTMYLTSEMTDLKKQLLNLAKEYPTIHPAVYVWEYENGKYLGINENEQFSAASIIKLPVLVRLFKSIEANQMTIFDDMTLTDYYKASGSGNLQYFQTGTKLTLDQLAKTMIQDSDNSATNMLMAKMGGMDDVNMGLRDWGISTTYVRTWLPDLGGTNKTTASDLAKILYNLDNPGFLNINSREYIIDYMSHVKNNKLIAAGLGEGALFVHKTGDIGSMLGDAGIVYAPNNQKYIIVILANRPYNAPQGKEFIVKASNLIYKNIVK